MKTKCKKHAHKIIDDTMDDLIKPAIRETGDNVINMIDNEITPSLKKSGDKVINLVSKLINKMLKDLF